MIPKPYTTQFNIQGGQSWPRQPRGSALGAEGLRFDACVYAPAAAIQLMKLLLERLRGGLNWLQWVSLLVGILVFAVFNLLLTLLLPARSHAEAWINVAAAVMAAGIAPYLLRTIDRIQRRADQKDNELRSLQAIAIDSALSPQYNLQSLLELAVKQATLAVDGEMGAFWLLDSRDPTRVAAQAFYNVPADRQYMLTEHLTATTEAQARQTGQPQRRQEIEESWPHDRSARLLQLRSTITIPIKNQDALLGLLMVGNRGGASPLAGFTEEDVSVLENTAAALSVAVQNMRLTEEKQRRGEMLRTLMSQTGEAVAASSDTKRLMQLLADAAAQILDCARVAVYAYQPDILLSGTEPQMTLQPLAVHPEVMDAVIPPHTLQTSATRLLLVTGVTEGPGGAARYVSSVGQTLGLSGDAAPLMDAPGYLFVLRSRDRRGIGLLCLLDDRECPPSEDRDAFAKALSAQASVALENALLGEQVRLDAERNKHVAEVFQTSMMPEIPAQIGTFEFDRKYQAALDESTLGGDFYDLFALGGDTIGVVMADVSGKGLKAAVQTAMVKYMLRGFAHESPRAPGDVLAHVNGVLSDASSGFEGFVTLFFGVLDTVTGDFLYANAGHEPPLWRDAAMGVVTTLDGESGLPLGSLPDGEYETHSRRFAPGEMMLLYTDGLSEARSPENVFLGTEGLEGYVVSSGDSARTAVESIYRSVRAFTGDNLRDDVAMLLFRRTV
jgi:serine phosphatase RsbU (regulator of sigma subunit)